MKYTQRRNSFSRFVPILLVIVITVVAVAAVIAIGRALFGKNDSGQTTDQNVNVGQVALLSTDAGSAVRLTVRGPIAEKKLDNNNRAYTELVYALDKRKMMEGTPLTEQQNDLRGICASGKIYKFETLKDNSVVKSLWTSDCSGSKGSAQANVNEILDMFLKQIPDGKKMAAGIGLSQEEALFKL